LSSEAYQYNMSLASWYSYLTVLHKALNAGSRNVDNASMPCRYE